MKIDKMSADAIANAVFVALVEYSETVDEIMQDEIDKVSRDVKKDLSTNSIIPKRTGDYKRGFRVKNVIKGIGFKVNKVYNVKHRIGHLLENGHLTRAGTRTQAFPHWSRAQKIAEQLPERVAKRLETGE